jgi:predicted Zn-dependent protease
MNLTVDGRSRNYILAAGLGVTLLAILIAFLIGAGQDRAYRYNYGQYQQAVKMMGNQKYAAALQIFQGLDADSQASYQVQYMEGYCAAQNGDYNTAANYMQKARETRPALLQDQKFLQRYGVILYHHGEYDRAGLYLRESLKYPGDAEAAQEARNYVAEIDKKLEGGRP